MATSVPVAARVFDSDLGFSADRRIWTLSLFPMCNWLFYPSMSNKSSSRAIGHLLPLRRRDTKNVRAMLLKVTYREKGFQTQWVP